LGLFVGAAWAYFKQKRQMESRAPAILIFMGAIACCLTFNFLAAYV
jgi:hypothetical protein